MRTFKLDKTLWTIYLERHPNILQIILSRYIDILVAKKEFKNFGRWLELLEETEND